MQASNKAKKEIVRVVESSDARNQNWKSNSANK